MCLCKFAHTCFFLSFHMQKRMSQIADSSQLNNSPSSSLPNKLCDVGQRNSQNYASYNNPPSKRTSSENCSSQGIKPTYNEQAEFLQRGFFAFGETEIKEEDISSNTIDFEELDLSEDGQQSNPNQQNQKEYSQVQLSNTSQEYYYEDEEGDQEYPEQFAQEDQQIYEDNKEELEKEYETQEELCRIPMQLPKQAYPQVYTVRPSKRSMNSTRKVRTTITREKLQAINDIFGEYSRQREEGKNPKLNLKEIGVKLDLGYSTILHKYREFRAAKVVKGGALIASLQKKRKYRKSLQIESIIENALNERPFYTAVELASYIQHKYGKSFSRSIISRHLGEMGYSYKNITSNPLQKNKPKHKDNRQLYALLLRPLLALSSPPPLLYIDELACSLPCFTKKRSSRPTEPKYSDLEEDYVSVIAAVASTGVLHYEVKRGFITRTDFCRVIVRGFKMMGLTEGGEQSGPRPLVICDTNRIHRDQQPQNGKIAVTLSKFGAHRYFLPPVSGQLSPLDGIFLNLKHRLWKRDIQRIDELKDLMTRNMQQIQREPTDIYFRDVAMNLEKALKKENI